MNTDTEHTVYVDLKELNGLQFKAKGFSFLPKQPVHSVLTGRHSSRLRGRGLNFEELRHYRQGDDIRTMDWKVTNRTGKPHVRVYTEERERPVIILIDQRMGMFFGSQWKMKSVIAAEVAALAAWRVVDVGDRVGAVIFNDDEIVYIKPQRNRNTVRRILAETTRLNHQLKTGVKVKQEPQRLNRVLNKVEKEIGHDYLLVMIGDGFGWDDQCTQIIKRISIHNNVISAFIYDPLEKDLAKTERMVLSDGHMQIEVDANSPEIRKQFSDEFASSVSVIEKEFKKHGIPLLPIHTLKPVDEQIRRLIGVSLRR